jgi:hypothetical protein
MGCSFPLRGRDRRALAACGRRIMPQFALWSPNYRFANADSGLTAASFDNPDFIDVVIQSYRIVIGMR